MDFSIVPLGTRTPITPTNGVPATNEGADGECRMDIVTGNMYIKQGGAWLTLVTPAQANTSNYPSGMGVRGVDSNGKYGQYSNTPIVVAASAIPSFTLNLDRTTNNAGAKLFENAGGFALPGGIVGPDGWYEVEIDWSCSNSAIVKQISVGVVQGTTNNTMAIQTSTTNQQNTMRLKIMNRNHTAQNVVNQGPGGPGSAASAPNVYTMDLNTDHFLWMYIAFGSTPGAGDTIRVERYTCTAFNPPVYSQARDYYGQKIFYGANAHYDYLPGYSAASIVAGMKILGIKMLRLAWEGTGSDANLTAIVNAINAENAANNTGLKVYMCIDLGMSYANEQAAYAGSYATALQVVQKYAPLGVTLYECGNEMDTKNGINTGDPQGGRPTDFSNTLVPIFRGVQRGAIDAVRSVAGCKAGSNAYTVCSIGLSDMMWNGTQPDGTSGYPKVRPDFMAWHNYEDYGPLVGVQSGNNRPWVNILEYLNREYQLPIYISEFNGRASDTDAQRVSWMNRTLYEYYANRYKFNIACIMVYQQLQGSPWGLLTSANALTATGTAVQSFITANPDTGT